jgi:hypothetical protein
MTTWPVLCKWKLAKRLCKQIGRIQLQKVFQHLSCIGIGHTIFFTERKKMCKTSLVHVIGKVTQLAENSCQFGFFDSKLCES